MIVFPQVHKEVLTAVRRNRERSKTSTAYTELLASAVHAAEDAAAGGEASGRWRSNPMDNVEDIREHDLPLHVRVSIDKAIFVGSWYQVECRGPSQEPVIKKREDLLERPDCIVLAYDIETTKLPLKFPDPNIDQV